MAELQPKKILARILIAGAKLPDISGAGPNPFAEFLKVLQEEGDPDRPQALRVLKEMEYSFRSRLRARAHVYLEPEIQVNQVKRDMEPLLPMLMEWAQKRIQHCPMCASAYFPSAMSRRCAPYCSDSCQRRATR